MRRAVSILGAAGLALSMVAAPAPGAAPDPIWQAAAEVAWRSKDAFPERIVSRTVICDGSGKRLESREEIERLTGVTDEKAVFQKEVKRDVVKDAGLNIRIDISAKDNPFFTSREGLVSYERGADEVLEGHECATYRFEERPSKGRSDGDVQVGTAWIEKATSLPLKVEYRYRKLPSHVSSYVLTVLFSPFGGGRCAPRKARMEMKGGFLFYRRAVTIEKSFEGWEERASGPAAGVPRAATSSK